VKPLFHPELLIDLSVSPTLFGEIRGKRPVGYVKNGRHIRKRQTFHHFNADNSSPAFPIVLQPVNPVLADITTIP
jgi:hypothetical protein